MKDYTTLANIMIQNFIAKAEDKENPACRIFGHDSDTCPKLFPAQSLAETTLVLSNGSPIPAEVRAFCKEKGVIKYREHAKVVQIWFTSYKYMEDAKYCFKKGDIVVNITYVIEAEKGEDVWVAVSYDVMSGKDRYYVSCDRRYR